MHPTEKLSHTVIAELLIKLTTDSTKSPVPTRAILTSDLIVDLSELGRLASMSAPEEEKDEVWAEFQDAVNLLKLCYKCNTEHWRLLFYSLLSMYLRDDDTFQMFYQNIKRAAEGIHRKRCNCKTCREDKNDQ